MIGHPGLLILVYPQHSPEGSVQVSGAVPLLHRATLNRKGSEFPRSDSELMVVRSAFNIFTGYQYGMQILNAFCSII